MGSARRPRSPGGPDLVLLDIMMPGMSGDRGARTRGEGRAPRLASIPVIILTAEGKPTRDVLTSYRAGADYYLTKPLVVDQLLSGPHPRARDPPALAPPPEPPPPTPLARRPTTVTPDLSVSPPGRILARMGGGAGRRPVDGEWGARA